MPGATREYKQAFKAIHDVLIKEWDPIGSGDEPRAQDEYDSYIPVIYRLIRKGADDVKIAHHLAEIETAWIGLAGDNEKNKQIASRLREVVVPVR